MDSFVLNGRTVHWDLLDQEEPATEQEKSVLTFMQQWKSGHENFTQYTSGSTGNPKKIGIQRSNMLESARMTVSHLDLDDRDHAYVCMNCAFIAGKMMLVRALVANMSLTIQDPSATPFDRLHIRPTFTAVVPLQLQNLLKQAAGFLSGFKAILVGGAPLSPALKHQAASLTVPIYETYGMTETVTHVALKRISGPHPETAFRVLPGITIRADNRSCLEIKGNVTNNQWVTTHDEVEIVSGHTFRWLGRADYVINSGGIKIHPEQIEKKIGEFFYRRNWPNRYLIGATRDDTLGECVTLYVEGRLPEEDSSVLDAMRYEFDPYQRPRKIIRIEHFPETTSGKLDRLALSKLYQA